MTNNIKRIIRESIDMVLFEDSLNNNEPMRATTEWMSKTYDKLNNIYFDGALGKCDFETKPTGSTSLGSFGFKTKKIKYRSYSRRMYYVDPVTHVQTNIAKDNFYDITKPVITLNSNYTATEHALTGTLLHEMCHYYTYMYGIVPKQSHGREFRKIAAVIASKSNGMFPIQRVATADEMTEYNLDQKVQDSVDKRNQSRYKGAMATLAYNSSLNRCELTITKDQSLFNRIVNYVFSNPNIYYCLKCSDNPETIQKLVDLGYSKTQRSFKAYCIPFNNETLKQMDDLKWEEHPIENTATANALSEDAEQQEVSEDVDITPDMDLSRISPAELL